MKQPEFRAHAGRNLDARANLRGPETAFAQSNCQAAVAHIVRRLRQLCQDNFADGLMYALLVSHIQTRRQTPEIFENHLSVLGSTEVGFIAISETAQQDP